MIGKEVVFIPAKERGVNVRVHDVKNDIISYQCAYPEVYASCVSGNSIYLLITLGADKTVRILKQKKNVEKLKFFINRGHFDVAYKFACTEKLSREVQVDILKHDGDMLYKKVRLSATL